MNKPERLTIGRVSGVFGVGGELKVHIESDFPERFEALRRVFLCGDEHMTEGARLHRGIALLKLQGIDDANAAAELVGCDVEVALADAVPLQPGKYFIFQIEGLQVETTDGERLGTLSEVLQTGGNDVYVVRRPDGGELLVPAIKQVVKQIDLERGTMQVGLMEGLR